MFILFVVLPVDSIKEEGKLKITWLLKYMYRKDFFWYTTDKVFQQSWKYWGFHWKIGTRHPLGGQQSWPAGLSTFLGPQVAKCHGEGESYWAVPSVTAAKPNLKASPTLPEVPAVIPPQGWQWKRCAEMGHPVCSQPVWPRCHQLGLFGTSQCREMHKTSADKFTFQKNTVVLLKREMQQFKI